MGTSPIIKFNPKRLTVRDDIDPANIGNADYPKHPKPIVVLDDPELLVVDGNRRALAALQKGEPILGVIVDDSYRLGQQAAVERAIGIHFRKKEGN